MQMKQL